MRFDCLLQYSVVNVFLSILCKKIARLNNLPNLTKEPDILYHEGDVLRMPSQQIAKISIFMKAHTPFQKS